MTLSGIQASKDALIAVARQSFIAHQQAENTRTGQSVVFTPSDEQLIALAPPLAQELQSLTAQGLQAQADQNSAVILDINTANTSAPRNSDTKFVATTSDTRSDFDRAAAAAAVSKVNIVA